MPLFATHTKKVKSAPLKSSQSTFVTSTDNNNNHDYAAALLKTRQSPLVKQEKG